MTISSSAAAAARVEEGLLNWLSKQHVDRQRLESDGQDFGDIVDNIHDILDTLRDFACVYGDSLEDSMNPSSQGVNSES